MGTRIDSMHATVWSVPTPAHLSIVQGIRPYLRALLRIGAGLLFMQHGLQKLFGMFGGMGPDGGTAPLMSQMGLAGVLELFGGLMLVFGLLTRPVAFLLACEMVIAYFQAHAPNGGLPIQNRGELALMYFLVFAYLFGDGAGPMSIDAGIERSRHGRIHTDPYATNPRPSGTRDTVPAGEVFPA